MFAQFLRQSGMTLPPGLGSLADCMRAMGGGFGGGGAGAGGFGGGAADFLPEARLREMHANALRSVKDAERTGAFLARVPGLDKTAAEHICTAPLRTLTETAIARLPREMPAAGMVATLTTVSEPMYSGSIGLLVKDSAGLVAQFGVYNWLHDPVSRLQDAQDAFPTGTVLRVLEPYLKRSNSGPLVLRLDNPINLQVVRRPGFTFAPPADPSDHDTLVAAAVKHAEGLKARGNEVFAAGRYAVALDMYSSALDVGDSSLLPSPLRLALHGNRAAAALKLQRYLVALTDSEAALAIDPVNEKASFRRCDALLGLCRVADAVDMAREKLAGCEAAAGAAAIAGSAGAARDSKAAAAAAESLSTWSAMAARCAEALAQSQGRIDLRSIPLSPAAQATEKTTQYIGPVAVRPAEGRKGWGLFATRDVAAGEVLLFERALCVRFEEPSGVAAALSLDGGRPALSAGTSHTLTSVLTHAAQMPGADADGQLTSKLASLCSSAGARIASAPPSEAAIHGAEPLPAPASPVSFSYIQGVVSINAFASTCRATEPSAKERAVRAAALTNPALLSLRSLDGAKGPRVVRPEPANAVMAAATEPAPAAGGAGGGKGGKGGSSSSSSGSGSSSSSGTPLKAALAALSPADASEQCNDKDSQGLTALHYAVYVHNAETIKTLIAAGADPNAGDAMGLTPVHLASAQCFNADVLAALLAGGGEVDVLSVRGLTPLHGAVMMGKPGAAKALLGKGANAFLQDYRGVSPIDLLYGMGKDDAGASGLQGDTAGVKAAFKAAGLDEARYKREVTQGSGLWWVASFMNHASKPNTARALFGSFMFVVAAEALPAGTELTTTYSDDKKTLEEHWGVKE